MRAELNIVFSFSFTIFSSSPLCDKIYKRPHRSPQSSKDPKPDFSAPVAAVGKFSLSPFPGAVSFKDGNDGVINKVIKKAWLGNSPGRRNGVDILVSVCTTAHGSNVDAAVAPV